MRGTLEARSGQSMGELPRRSRKGLILTAAAILAAAGITGGFLALRGGSGGKPKLGVTLPTATVIQTDMSAQTQIDGTLSHSGSYTVSAMQQGYLTWLPAVGAVIKRGRPVFDVNNHHVPLFYSPIPFWRTIQDGMSDGVDVLELKRNLAALGYGSGMTLDEHYDPELEDAIMAWQDDQNLTETGKFQVGDAITETGPIRVATVSALLGNPVQGTVLTATNPGRQVVVNLPVSQEEVATVGAQVEIALPGGKTTTGHITSIGSLASAGATNSQSQTGTGTQTATVPVYISTDHPDAAGNLDGAPVTVGFTSAVHKNALAVPVAALLANPDGTFYVDVVASGHVHPVTVTLGIFANDEVEVTGNLAAGEKVEVPAS
jgi:peptidoglycan hydrolase-like protein with peptidoglycan-binding domain